MSRYMSVDRVHNTGSGQAPQPSHRPERRALPTALRSVHPLDLPGDLITYFQKRLMRKVGARIDPERLSLLLLLAALITLLLAAAPGAQAQGSCKLLRYPFYVNRSGDYMSGSHPIYRNSSCSPPSSGTVSFGKYGTVFGGSRESAIAKCISRTSISNMSVGPVYSTGWSCKPLSSSGKSGAGQSGDVTFDGDYYKPEVQVTKLPLGNIMVSAELGLNSGILFQRYDHYAVGIQAVVDRGILDVVDVWGHTSQRFEVCFPQAGAIVFIDATTMPRRLIDIDSVVRDGYTCAAMNRAGQVVLVKGSSSSHSRDTLAQKFIDSTTDDLSSAIALNNCTVSSVHNLNLREEPWGVKITVLPKQTGVPAIARTESWYKVRFSQAEADTGENGVERIEGWVSAWLSQGEGDCEWRSDDEDSPALASSENTPAVDELSVASLVRELGL